MLDQDTKQHIDSARDILVGKIPDPKAQVEQITTALIYKFMDDMDRENLALGLNAQFFVGEWEKYAWSKLMSKKNSGQERMNLYVEGIASFPKNEHLPQLFRDIFKDAFLPFRDPRTLNLFLKEIDWFSYEHSENLGNAFEYLLSVLGSQGDAGQFRTPRHIIDFIVAVVNPQKEDRILDPACGTAGFLISAYKHILANTQEEGLTPEEKVRLVNNVVGYDISPDMVKLALVNLYLHSFPKPQIFEYDTLTSEERWDDVFDVILANPPFMTPKGGIDPHKKFQVQARRAEVLFVDYIAEHLKLNGRAGIIVPEGIIFQSSNAYKALRKTLIQNYGLYAVVSLPAGVFNPYSGVKTSILLLDRKLAKLTDDFLFVKIENDGFNLGAQRRAVEGDELSKAFAMIQRFQEDALAKTEFDADGFGLGHVVKKKDILESGDFNLSGERYKIIQLKNNNYDIYKISEIFKTSSGGTPLKNNNNYYENGSIPWVNSGEVRNGEIFSVKKYITEEGLNNSSAKLFPQDSVLIAMYGATAGQVGILKIEATTNQAICGIYPNYEKANPRYVYYMLRGYTEKMIALSIGGAQQNISQKIIKNIQFPLPPLEIQEEIVAELDGYQKIVDGARQVVENYRPTFEIDPEWEMVELGEVCDFIDYRGKTPPKTEHGIPLITAKNVKKGIIQREPREFIAEDYFDKWMTRGIPKKGDVLITTEAPLGNVAQIITDEKLAFAQRIIILSSNSENLSNSYLMYCLLSNYMQSNLHANKTGSTVYGIKAKTLKTIKFPIPNIKIQNEIVAQLKTEQNLINANKELIEIFEKKIENRVNSIWGK